MQRDQPRAFPTILVVEDDELVRATAVALLDTQGYDVLEAATAEAALQLLGAEPDIRLVFTDVHFPGVNCGLNLACHVHERWPDIALLITSGRHDVALEGLPVGSRFIAKPYRATSLFGEIAALLPIPAGGIDDRTAADGPKAGRLSGLPAKNIKLSASAE
jgi:two-component system, response regulator PdtaR